MRKRTLLSILCLILSGGFVMGQSITNQYYNVKSNSGTARYGVRFWNGSNYYKISMGNSADYKFGPVQDYSIKMNMNNDENRGWTWGVLNHEPNAALDTDGNYQTAVSVKSPTLIAQSTGTGRLNLIGKNSSNIWATSQISFSSQYNTNAWYISHRGDKDTYGKRDLNFYHHNASANKWWKFIQLRDNGDSDFEHKGVNRITLHSFGLKLYGGTQQIVQVQENGLLVGDQLWMRDWDNNGQSMIHFGVKSSTSAVDARWTLLKECGTPIMRLEAAYPNKPVQTVVNFSLADDPDNSHRTGAFHGEWQAQRVKVTSDAWCDYVFDKEYDLMPLTEVKEFIAENGHLPNVKSAKQIEAEGGIELGEQVRMLLEKVEELTLYTIALQEEVQALKKEKSDQD